MNESELEAKCSVPGLKPWREPNGLSQTDVAVIVGKSRGTIGRYEAGLRHPTIPKIDSMAKELGCTRKTLLTPPSYPEAETGGTVKDV